MTHQGTESTVESISLRLNVATDKDACIFFMGSRMFWLNIYSDIFNFIKEYDIYQKVNAAVSKAVPELQPVLYNTYRHTVTNRSTE